MYAFVFRKNTPTMGETPTAASPVPAPPETATDVRAGNVRKSRPLSGTIGASDAVAVREIAPAASPSVTLPAVVSESMNAWVSTSRRMFTTIAAPTALPSSENAPARARLCSPSGAVAVPLTGPVDVRRAPFPTEAVVRKSTNWTAIEPATLTSDLPPAGGMPPAGGGVRNAAARDGDGPAHPHLRFAAGGRHAPDGEVVALPGRRDGLGRDA